MTPAKGRIVGIDLGEKRIGVAWADTELCLAVGARTLEPAAGEDSVSAVAVACRQLDAERVVIGKPVNMNGTEGPAVEKVRRFSQALRERTGLPVELWDERLTTASVQRSLIAADVSRGKRRGMVDRLAAQTILQSYMDARAGLANSGSVGDEPS